MTIKALYPTIEPSLELDFANTKALDPRISFTRASTGTCVGADGLIKAAASGVARFDHDPATGRSLGLLVEEARTNLITYSEQFDNAAWSKQTNTTVTANTHVAPDGTTTADTINAISNEIIGSATVTASTTYTVSVFIRKTTGATIFPMLAVNVFTSGAQRIFNTNTGQLVVRTAALNTGIQCESVGSYWRVSYSGNVGSNTTLSFLIYAAGSTDGSNYSGGFTGSIVAWGAQVEAGSFPTSYIPTVASAVTRAADVASMTGTNFSSWYNQSQGSVVFVGSRQSSSASTGNYNIAVFDGVGGTSKWGFLTVNAGDGAKARFGIDTRANSGSFTFPAFTTQDTANVAFKAGLTISSSPAFGCVNGTGGQQISYAGTNPTPDSLILGGILPGHGTTSGRIAHLAYYPVRLPDAQLQALTAT